MTNVPEETPRAATDGVQGFTANTDDLVDDLDLYEALIDPKKARAKRAEGGPAGGGMMPMAMGQPGGAAGAQAGASQAAAAGLAARAGAGTTAAGAGAAGVGVGGASGLGTSGLGGFGTSAADSTLGGGIDTDGDGIPDYFPGASASGGMDTNGDGIPDYWPEGPYAGGYDTDGDGVPDYWPGGRGGDGNYSGGIDTNGDGIPDYWPDGPYAGGHDTDGDGIPDSWPGGSAGQFSGGIDTNGDGVPDYWPSGPFAGGRDTNGDGIPDYWPGGSPGRFSGGIDTNGDGLPDYWPTGAYAGGRDTNGDGIPDYWPTGPYAGGRDTNGDGIPDWWPGQDPTPGGTVISDPGTGGVHPPVTGPETVISDGPTSHTEMPVFTVPQPASTQLSVPSGGWTSSPSGSSTAGTTTGSGDGPSGATVSVDIKYVRTQSRSWDDWAASMSGLVATVQAANATSQDFGQVTPVESSYSSNQERLSTWTSNASVEFGNMADTLTKAAEDYARMNDQNSELAQALAQQNRLPPSYTNRGPYMTMA